MSVKAKAYVRPALPVLEVVARTMAGPRKVGDLVLLHTGRTERGARLLIPVCCVVLARDGQGAIASSLLQHLASQPRLVVHFEHINAEVRSAACDGLLDRIPPTLSSL